MKQDQKTKWLCILFPLAAGGIFGFLTRGGMKNFSQLEKPPLSPPGVVFPLVWTVLYLLMGWASWLVLSSGGKKDDIRKALLAYGIQLMMNLLWPVFFFGLGRHWFSFFWLLILFFVLLSVTRQFSEISMTAGRLLLPYLIWILFAGYLNLGVALLN